VDLKIDKIQKGIEDRENVQLRVAMVEKKAVVDHSEQLQYSSTGFALRGNPL
jgi:hypothetical protein